MGKKKMYKKYRITYYDYTDCQHFDVNIVALSEENAEDSFYEDYDEDDVSITTIEEI